MNSRGLPIPEGRVGDRCSFDLYRSNQLRFESRVNPPLACQLAIVVQHRVKRLVRVGRVVRDHRRKETDVFTRVRRLLGEGLDEPPVHLL